MLSKVNKKVAFFFNKATNWKEEFEKLREIVLACDLVEELKWGVPCYIYQKNNIVLIHGFKEYCALLFFKGALLKDSNNILIQQTKNVQAARQIRFTSLQDILKKEQTIKDYIYEAIEIEKSGLKINYKKTTEFTIPLEFLNRLNENSLLKTAFNALTPGRQRAYLLYFSTPKQPKTREERVEKYTEKILQGKGLAD